MDNGIRATENQIKSKMDFKMWKTVILAVKETLVLTLVQIKGFKVQIPT
jgi:hypothetical protein